MNQLTAMKYSLLKWMNSTRKKKLQNWEAALKKIL